MTPLQRIERRIAARARELADLLESAPSPERHDSVRDALDVAAVDMAALLALVANASTVQPTTRDLDAALELAVGSSWLHDELRELLVSIDRTTLAERAAEIRDGREAVEASEARVFAREAA